MARQREGRVVKVKDPNAPKRPVPLKLRAFQNYLREYLEKNPVDKSVKGHFKTLQKQAGKHFKQLSEVAKMTYCEMEYEAQDTPAAPTTKDQPAAKKPKKK